MMAHVQAMLSDGSVRQVEVVFVVVCTTHLSAVGPYDDLQKAAADAARMVGATDSQTKDDDGDECAFTVLPVLRPDEYLDAGDKIDAVAYEPGGYL